MAHIDKNKSEIIYQQSYPEPVWRQVTEAMQRQHRETERRQLWKTESMIFQTGHKRSRKYW